METPRDIVQIINSIGFTTLEAEIYTYLLQHSPATGYRIAKGIGRLGAVLKKKLGTDD